nr:protein-L-isoaspartate O-methyltransferase [Rhodoligotrophos defluvii]
MIDYATKRRNMVESQLRPNGVTDPRINTAMLEIPRELFVAPMRQPLAYIDEDVAITDGSQARYIMEPMVFARLIQLAEVGPGDVVLDIGCGLGYSSAVLARLAQSVVGLEEDPQLVADGNARLAQIGAANAVLVQGHLNQGYPQEAPYDVIVINGQVAEVPSRIFSQLRDGGRLVAVIDHGPIGKASLFTVNKGAISQRIAFDASVVRLPGFEKQRPLFTF